ncbi:TonB-dependent receptor domain-containing protein [Chenggangzhangella methanolivorans]|uniref:TonB-dependent receptor domain-containing protein n=1 Tax=Chenggangzhangella methanolivorans TaxID=1437009 RepID=UPI003204F9DD
MDRQHQGALRLQPPQGAAALPVRLRLRGPSERRQHPARAHQLRARHRDLQLHDRQQPRGQVLHRRDRPHPADGSRLQDVLHHRRSAGLEHRHVGGHPQSGPQPAAAVVPYLDQTSKLHQAGAFIQDQARFGDGFIATLNGRYDRIWLDGDSRLSNDVKMEKGRFSGRAGLGYEFENGIVPYVSVASTFNPLIGYNSVGGVNEPFKPETGIQYEAGIKWSPTAFPAIFTASVFDLTKKNVVSGPFNAQNQIGEVRSRGFELEAQANLTENWKLLAAFTAYDLEIQKGVGADPVTGAPVSLKGEQPFLVPEVIGSAFLDYTFTAGQLKGLSLGGGVRYIGKSEATQPNTVKVPDATLVDAAVRYQWDNYKVSLNVTNLFDKRFVSGCQGINVCSFGEGRRALVRASYTW